MAAAYTMFEKVSPVGPWANAISASDLVRTRGNAPLLRIALTQAGEAFLQEYFRPGMTWEIAKIRDRFDPRFQPDLFDPDSYDELQMFDELIEHEVSNGWTRLDPNEFVLTSDPYLLTDEASEREDGTHEVSYVYFYNEYAMRDPVDELARHGFVLFAGRNMNGNMGGNMDVSKEGGDRLQRTRSDAPGTQE